MLLEYLTLIFMNHSVHYSTPTPADSHPEEKWKEGLKMDYSWKGRGESGEAAEWLTVRGDNQRIIQHHFNHFILKSNCNCNCYEIVDRVMVYLRFPLASQFHDLTQALLTPVTILGHGKLGSLRRDDETEGLLNAINGIHSVVFRFDTGICRIREETELSTARASAETTRASRFSAIKNAFHLNRFSKKKFGLNIILNRIDWLSPVSANVNWDLWLDCLCGVSAFNLFDFGESTCYSSLLSLAKFPFDAAVMSVKSNVLLRLKCWNGYFANKEPLPQSSFLRGF